MRSIGEKISRSRATDGPRWIGRALTVVALCFTVGSQGFAVEQVLQFGGSGTDDGEFAGINGIDVGDDGRIYVTDVENARVQVFAPDGSFLHAFGSPGTGDGEFDIGLCGIVVDDRLERVFVSEGVPGAPNHRVQAFDLDGTFLFDFGSPGSGVPPVGSRDAEFDGPCQMVVDADGNLYVVDQGNSRVQVFDPRGGFRFAFGASGPAEEQLSRPSGIAIDRSGRLFVADAFDNRIQVYDLDGNFVTTFGGPGSGEGQFSRPCHLAQGGMLFVADAMNERIQVLDLDGNFHLQVPQSGSGISVFCGNVPTGLATDRLGRIYVEEGDFVTVYSIDRDGDGLLDQWETSGVDTDGDGTVDLPIHEPPYNADPDHKDLYLEMDWDEVAPVDQNVVDQMKQTLCAAPVDAGGVPNPDGEPGIRLHVDTGSLTDPAASESPWIPCSCRDGRDNNDDGVADADDPACYALDPAGGEGGRGLATCADDMDNDGDGVLDEDDSDCPQVYDEFATESSAFSGQCDDGMDNDGDGRVDADDPDCLVGDDLGGGSALTDGSGGSFGGDVCGLAGDFYNAKALNFAAERALVFRYHIQAPNCDLDGDGDSDTRSRAELGGNDAVHMTLPAADVPAGARLSPASYVHELGHNLDLTHGGDDAANCEPNYVSIMNYDSGLGLKRVTNAIPAGAFDYSPPRFPDGRGTAPLLAGTGILDESDLDERTIMDPTDRLHQFVYVNAMGEKVRSPLNGDVDQDGVPDGVDWNGDGDVTDASGLMVNIDTSGPDGRPEECTNGVREELTGHDDWSNMTLPFRQYGDLADAPVNPTQVPEPTREERIAQERTLNTADTAVALSAAVSPVEVGTDLAFEIDADNFGPNPADRVRVTSTLPAGEGFVSGHPSCAESAAGEVSCEFGPLPPGTSAELDVGVTTAGACVDGVPQPLAIGASIANVTEFAGDDPMPGDNEAVLTVDTVDTTGPTPACNAPATIAPPDAPASFTASAEDLCDSTLEPTVTSVQCYRVNGGGRRVDLPCHATFDGATLDLQRTGGVGTRIEWTVAVQDESGNHAEKACLLRVERP